VTRFHGQGVRLAVPPRAAVEGRTDAVGDLQICTFADLQSLQVQKDPPAPLRGRGFALSLRITRGSWDEHVTVGVPSAAVGTPGTWPPAARVDLGHPSAYLRVVPGTDGLDRGPDIFRRDDNDRRGVRERAH
jgi:hypothetical protein